ncbi:hypothetical protein [Seohaeicola zhoushanensis]|uniref:Uncharacterized protein n=1 Tax=Seohaeicola zhoushanensis TaxID=1569283 RepID=A0A8J3H029_9RHOB|nr:hypothetical protein [Seohaeicola zhoushanensis]GHF57965.1 hypothetical protein GCM10017056_31830 [Seohaeicola zhoushanensis]
MEHDQTDARKEAPENQGPGASRMIVGLALVCAVLFLADFAYEKHVYVPVESMPGFYAIFPLVTCLALVIVARVLQAVLRRPVGYYAPKDVETEAYPEDGLNRERADV